YTLHSLLMAGAVIAALALIRPMVGYVRKNFELVATGALLFYPLLRSVTGGQNTALSLLALAAIWRLLHDDQQLAAGLVIALLMFKPQFAIPLIGLMFLTRRWRAATSAVFGSAVLWLAAAGLMGVNWLTVWWNEVADFASIDAEVNGHNAISWLGVGEHLFGPGSTAAAAFAGPAVLASIGAVVWVWTKPNLGLDVRIAATALALILISPHAMFYDAGLLVLAAVVLLDRLGSDAYMPIAICWFGAWLHLGASWIDFSILFVVMVLTSAIAAKQLWRSRKVRRRDPVAGHDESCSPTPQLRPTTQ
ncbi:MAG: glycosyltransferase family 87 protein, partial [Acidimicrobiales bacterium]